jgi:hypothetical protein
VTPVSPQPTHRLRRRSRRRRLRRRFHHSTSLVESSTLLVTDYSRSGRGKRRAPRHESRRDASATPTRRRLHRELPPTRASGGVFGFRSNSSRSRTRRSGGDGGARSGGDGFLSRNKTQYVNPKRQAFPKRLEFRIIGRGWDPGVFGRFFFQGTKQSTQYVTDGRRFPSVSSSVSLEALRRCQSYGTAGEQIRSESRYGVRADTE